MEILFENKQRMCLDSGFKEMHSLAAAWSILTHWGRVTLIYKLTIIGSDHGLSPSRCHVIIWINAGIIANICLYQDLPKTWEVMALKIWWRHQMETFSALRVICAGNSPVPGEFPAQRPVTRSFDVFFHLRLNKRLSKQSWGWWFETPSRSLWRHRSEACTFNVG